MRETPDDFPFLPRGDEGGRESGKEVDPSVFTDLSEFMQTFGDKCHHAKEEEYLFKLLEKKGVPVSGCPLAVLLHEHEKGRSLIDGITMKQ